MLVITSRKEVGNFLGFPVFQVTSMKFLPCDEALKLSTSQEVSFLLIIPLIFLLKIPLILLPIKNSFDIASY